MGSPSFFRAPVKTRPTLTQCFWRAGELGFHLARILLVGRSLNVGHERFRHLVLFGPHQLDETFRLRYSPGGQP